MSGAIHELVMKSGAGQSGELKKISGYLRFYGFWLAIR